MTTTGAEIDMPDDEQETYDATEVDEGKWGALRMIGLLALLAAFAGFVYLAYMQGVRNGAVGAPPVLTADSSPYKIVPPNPGGAMFATENRKMIDDRVEGAEAGTTVPRSQVSAQEVSQSDRAPAYLVASDDDMVTHRSAPLVVAEAPAPIATTTPVEAEAPVIERAPAPVAEAVTIPRQSADSPPDGIAAAIEKADGQGGPVDAADEIAPKEADKPIVATSPVKAAEPQVAKTVTETKPVTQAPPVAQSTTTGAGTTASIGPTPPIATTTAIAAGSYVVQVASSPDRSAAEEAWGKFNKKNSDLLSSYTPDYQSADVPGKGSRVRVRIGPFNSKDDANALCEQLKSRSQGCLVVKT